jgi:hypothetical protein
LSTHSAVTIGNSKLGMLIAGWSLPPGEEKTCPGETPACRMSCYAKAGFFRMQSTKDAHEKNLLLSQQPDFAEWMTAKIRVLSAPVVRVHVSGDYYDNEYTQKWGQIIRSLRTTTFFSYTRSWQIPELLPELLQLASHPNMHLWWSLDRDASDAPYVSGIRRAYMAMDDADAAAAPADCDLVFRVRPKTVMKKANTVFVCPPENGVKLPAHITCSKCGVCWAGKRPKWEQALWDASNNEGEVFDILAN